MSLPLTRLFSRSVEALALGAMTVLLPLSPITCALLSGQPSYLRQFRGTFIKSARYTRALKRSRVISRNLQRKLTASTGKTEIIQGSCTHCGQCCVDRSCVFLQWSDTGTSQCAIYGNWYWKQTSCGSYPIDGESIAVYDCPSFKSIPIKVVRSGISLQI